MFGRSALFELAAHRPNRWVALHHLLLALTLASLMVIVARSPIYFEFDLLTHSFLSFYGLGSDSPKDEQKPSAEPVPTELSALLPHFVVAGPRLEDLMSKHPDAVRQYNGDVLAAILSQHPRLIAVSNLDLAPIVEPQNDPQLAAEQAGVDAVLDGAKAGGTQVILSFQLPHRPPSLESLRIKWIVERCAKGVLFGIPMPGLRHEGIMDEGAMLYRKNYPSLGVVAAEMAARQPSEERTSGPLAALVCDLAKDADGDVKKFMEDALRTNRSLQRKGNHRRRTHPRDPFRQSPVLSRTAWSDIFQVGLRAP